MQALAALRVKAVLSFRHAAFLLRLYTHASLLYTTSIVAHRDEFNNLLLRLNGCLNMLKSLIYNISVIVKIKPMFVLFSAVFLRSCVWYFKGRVC